MKIHHLRNATCIIESGQHHILVDPMLGPKSTLPPFSYLKHRAQRNPLVNLPPNADELLAKVTLCLLTHSQKWGIDPLTHTDHLDPAGASFLKERGIPVICPANDSRFLKRKGMDVVLGLEKWNPTPLEDTGGSRLPIGTITAVPARHGHSWTRHLMANGCGFYLELDGSPSVYITGDTVYTQDVEQALNRLQPDIAIAACGSAALDIGGSILMPMEEIITFIQKAPGMVVANHMDALNHCSTTRPILKEALETYDLSSKVMIPNDGETLRF